MPRGGLVAIQREQAALMQRPMVGTPMVGDPRIHGMTVGDHTGAPRSIKGAFGHLAWRIGQYAAAMLSKAGIVGADASGLEARFEPPATVVFTLPLQAPPDFNRPPEQPIEIARYTVPAHVMAYDPHAHPVARLAGPEETIMPDPHIKPKRSRVCRNCNETFVAKRPSDRALFCSNRCAGIAKRTLPRPTEKQCLVCAKVFTPTAQYPAKRFCSRKCWLSTQHTTEHQSHAGARGGSKRAEAVRGTGKGYVKRGGRHEHRSIAEAVLGRPLLPDEIVHHRDETKSNNQPENLEILSSQSEHAKLHFTGKRHSAEHVAKRMASRAATMKQRAAK